MPGLGPALTCEHGLGDTVGQGSERAQNLNSKSQTGRSSFSEFAGQIVEFALCHLVRVVLDRTVHNGNAVEGLWQDLWQGFHKITFTLGAVT